MFNHYAGIVGYADDNWHLAPSRSALQEMIDTCQQFALEHNFEFSTNIVTRKMHAVFMDSLKLW